MKVPSSDKVIQLAVDVSALIVFENNFIEGVVSLSNFEVGIHALT